MSAYRVRLTGFKAAEMVHEIPYAADAAEEAEKEAKRQAAQWKDRTVLVYQDTIYGGWRAWKAWKWNAKRRQPESEAVQRGTWDEYMPRAWVAAGMRVASIRGWKGRVIGTEGTFATVQWEAGEDRPYEPQTIAMAKVRNLLVGDG